MVYKGVWISPDVDVDVAVKTLKEGSGEEDRVKFLQEACSHHGTVQTPQCGGDVWSGHRGRTSESL